MSMKKRDHCPECHTSHLGFKHRIYNDINFYKCNNCGTISISIVRLVPIKGMGIEFTVTELFNKEEK